MYDVIVVGARCAGSPTAMLLARKGYRVLLLDRAAFPSDTISTHVVWSRGLARLKRWGLMDRVLASNCPTIHSVTLDVGPFALTGSPPPVDGVSGFAAPRRTVLDRILVDAAVESGAELRENCSVVDILKEGDRVTGVRCRTPGGTEVLEHATVVIGADGRNSVVARAVGAPSYNARPSLSCWYYTYWSGIPAENFEMLSAPNRAVAVIPTNDGLVAIPIALPASERDAYRADIEGNYLATIDLIPALADRVRQGKREERFFGLAEIPNFFRKSFGPGWALVGDAGYHKDPVTAQGISDAFYGAELLTDALDAGLSAREPLDTALSRYTQLRDEAVMPMYELTCDWASFAPPPPEMQGVFGAMRYDQTATDRFFGTLSGAVPIPEFYAPENLERIAGALDA